MWQKSYTKVYKNVDKEKIWALWSDINNWHLWNPGIEYCKLEGPFVVGSTFTLKPKKGPVVTLSLVEVEKPKLFTDCSVFFGAKMYGKHEIIDDPNGVRLTTTMTVTGPLSFLWRKLVAEDIVAKLPEQTDALVQLASKK